MARRRSLAFEHDKVIAFVRRKTRDGNHLESDLAGFAEVLDSKTLLLHHGVGLNGCSHRFPQNGLETLVSHSQQVMARLTLRGLQVKARATAKLQDLHTGVDDDAIGRVPVLDGAVGALLQLGAVQGACDARLGGRLREPCGSSETMRGAGRRGRTSKQLVLAIDDTEEFRGGRRRFRAAQEQKSVADKRVMEEREDCFLERGDPR